MVRKHQGAVSSVQTFGMRCLVLCTLNLVAVVLVLVLIIVVVKYYSYINSSEKRVCLTKECIAISATLLSRMDIHADPCENMYRYACGGWMDDITEQDTPGLSLAEESVRNTDAIHQEILASEGNQLKGKNSTAVSKTKLYYQSCMDETTINSLGPSRILKLINQMGSWTVTSYGLTPWDRNSWQLQKAVELMHQIGSFVFFRMSVIKTKAAKTGKIIELSIGDPTVSSIHYTNDDLGVKNIFNAAFASAKFLSADKKFNQGKLEEVIKFDLRLAELGRLTQMTFDENDTSAINIINNGFTWIDLKHYLMTSLNVKEIPTTTTIFLDSISYFKQLETLIKATDKEVLANYIAWSLIAKYKDFLPDIVSDSFRDLDIVHSHDLLASQNRDDVCLKHAQRIFGHVTSALFLQDYFPASSKAQVNKVLVNVRKQFIASLDTIDWLDEAIKKEIIKEAEAMKHSSVNKDWLVDPKRLDDFYDHYKVIPGEYLESNVAINKMLRSKSLDVNAKPVNKRHSMELMEISHNIDALPKTYKYMTSNFVFIDTFLQPPIFDPRFPIPIRYGAIGFIIGHELVQRLEDNNPLMHVNKSLDYEVTSKATDNLQNKIQCIVDQYNGYKVHDRCVNGSLTVMGNIADNIGLELAYRAYKTVAQPSQTALPGLNLTNDQLFFLGFTQLWCASYSPEVEVQLMNVPPYIPEKYRAQGPLSNNQEFSKAFMCRVNETMNPAKKCKMM